MPVKMHPETAVGQLKAGDYAFPLQSVDVRGTLRGLLYSATVKQTFKNERDTRMEAVYVFPLPPKAAVHGFTLTVGDRVIQGEIKERGQARREYKQAVASGHRAALMEEERSDIFTTTVGNIGPSEEVQIEFELSGPLSCFRNTARLRLPLVVGEVYIPGKELAGDSVGSGVTADTDQVPDASRITPPRLADGAPNPVALSVSFLVEPSGLRVEDVLSTCHFARTKSFKDGRYRVSLLPGVERMDKAFVLEVTYPEKTLQTSLLVDEDNKAFALTVVPPVAKERQTHPRDVVILLDRSGSMGGWPMIAARRAAARIVESLTQDDRFGIIAFDNGNQHFDRKLGLCHANNFYKMRAAEYLSKIEARGGTEMLPALKEGLQYFNSTENRDPHIILVTDGDVGNDSSLIRSCQSGIRISTVGIGYAAREGLLNRMAETSGGVCSLIPNEADLDTELAEMHRKWGQPVWKGLSLKGADESFRSPKFWDVWQDIPTTFFGRLDELPETTVVKGWFQGRGEYSQEVSPIKTDDAVVYRAWARSRLLDLEDQFLVNQATSADMVSLSVSAQVLCRFTAFTAVDKTEKVDMEREMDRVVQPVEQTKAKKRKANAIGFRAKGSSGAPEMLRSSWAGASTPSPARPAPPAPGGGGGDAGRGWLGDDDLFDAAPAADCFEEVVDDVWCDDEFMDEGGDWGGDSFSVEAIPTEKRAIQLPSIGGVFGKMKEAIFGRGDEDKKADSAMSIPEEKLKQEAQSLPKPKPVAPAPRADEAQELKNLLMSDKLLQAGDSPTADVIRASLKVVESLISKLTKMLRDGFVDDSYGDSWRAVLARLMDYQEALEDINGSSGVKSAKALRKEVEDLMQSL